MAGLAIGNRVGSHEGKSASGMNFESFLLVLPAASCVAILTKGAKLSAVGIGVTVSAIFGDVCECQIVMASHALDLLMLTGEWKAGLLVRERFVRSHLGPAAGRMAGRAIKLDVTVRVITLGESCDCESGSESNCQTYS